MNQTSIPNSYIQSNICPFVSFQIANLILHISHVLYFPAHKMHFFFPPEKCDLNSTCFLCAESKYYFQTYKYPYPHRVKTTMKMILVTVTTIFWVSTINKLYYGC